MLQINSSSMDSIREQMLAPKLREFLHEHFPESRQIPNADMDGQLRELIPKARLYQITDENHLRAYVSSAWLLGPEFDQDFPQIARVLQDFKLASFEKAEFLWTYCDGVFATLEPAD